MKEKVEGLVIDIRRHNDRSNVVTLYTRRHGCVSFVSSVSQGRRGRMRAATIMPLACIAADVSFRGDRALQTLPEVYPARLWTSLYFHPVKSALAMFTADFLNSLLRSYPPDEPLYIYLVEAVACLDALPSDRLANFHIALLSGLLGLTGIFPRIDTWREGRLFDMAAGEYVDYPFIGVSAERGNVLGEVESRFIPLLARITFDNMHHFRFSRKERERLLTLLIRYFGIHLPLWGNIKSLDILKEIFS